MTRPLTDLATPAAIVDVDVLERNCTRMATRARALGVVLRPHVKTHKCAEIARLQHRDDDGRAITVSTLAEAEHFARAGFDDITWAVPLPPHRIEEAVRACAGISRLHLVVDQEATRRSLEHAARRAGRRVSVYLKVDCGYHRAGIDPGSPGSVELARRLAESDTLRLAGVLTHGGHAYACRDRSGLVKVAAEERDVTVAFAERLRRESVPVASVSIGSTPTLSVVDHLHGVDEIRPGNYAFHDLFQATVGACGLDDIAFEVLGTVIGDYPERDTIVLDTGGTALSLDPGPRHVDPNCGFGAARRWDRGGPGRGFRIVALSQEHAKVHAPAGARDRPGLGDRVRVTPNHACMAAAAFDRYHVVRGEVVVDAWRPAKYWSGSGTRA